MVVEMMLVCLRRVKSPACIKQSKHWRLQKLLKRSTKNWNISDGPSSLRKIFEINPN